MDTNTNVQPKKRTTLQTVALVFMILNTVSWGFFLLPLAWMLPMTISYAKKTKNGVKVSTGFKVCTLLFTGNLVSFILMLIDKN